MIKYLIYNIINLICFIILAIIFCKWWIIFFALLFTIIPNALYKDKQWRVCDSCGRWSESGDCEEEAIKRAKQCGWLHIETSNKDFCPDCLNQIRGGNKQ